MMRELMGGGGSATDKSGVVRLGPMRDTAGKLMLTAAGYVSQNGIAVDPAVTTQTVEMVRGLVIAGRIAVPEGVPPQVLRVRLSSQQPGRWVSENPTIAKDGSFRVDTLEHDGDYELRVSGEWENTEYEGKMTVSTGTADVVLEVTAKEQDPKSTLIARVRDAEGKLVVSGTAVLHSYAADGGGRRSNQRNLSGGEVVFNDVDPDRDHWLEIYGASGSSRGSVLEPVALTGEPVEVTLPSGRAIEGSVVGPDGAPVRGVRVTATAKDPKRENRTFGAHGDAVSDGKGLFAVKGLGDMDYVLSFKAPDQFGPVPKQTVRGGTRGVSVTLKAGLIVTLTLIDYKGKPVVGARPWLSLIKPDGGTEWVALGLVRPRLEQRR